MIWLNGWAWIGAVAIGVPLAVHLLARRRATRVSFPTLRFLEASSRLSVRRDRLTDLVLLAVRAAIILAAVAALAQPFIMTATRRRDVSASLSRAIVVDTSASLQRPATAGGPGIDAARAEGQRLAADTSAHRVIEASDLAAAVASALAWLAGQAGRHEVAIVTDFQTGALTPADLAAVPAGTGIRLVRIAMPAIATVTGPPSMRGTRTTRATTTVTATGTDTEWTTTARAAGGETSILLLAGATGAAGVAAAHDAAFAIGVPTPSPDRPSAIVFPDAAERPQLVTAAASIDRPWMFDAVQALVHDTTLAAAAQAVRLSSEAGTPTVPAPDHSTVVARDSAGSPLVLAASGDVAGARRLIVFSLADPGSVASAALIAGVARATSGVPPIAEIDPTTLSADEVKGWERAPTDVAPPTGSADDSSDGRWLWAAALVLIGVESWIRRRPRAAAAAPVVYERVA